jgi:hypothetical protein
MIQAAVPPSDITGMTPAPETSNTAKPPKITKRITVHIRPADVDPVESAQLLSVSTEQQYQKPQRLTIKLPPLRGSDQKERLTIKLPPRQEGSVLKSLQTPPRREGSVLEPLQTSTAVVDALAVTTGSAKSASDTIQSDIRADLESVGPLEPLIASYPRAQRVTVMTIPSAGTTAQIGDRRAQRVTVTTRPATTMTPSTGEMYEAESSLMESMEHISQKNTAEHPITLEEGANLQTKEEFELESLYDENNSPMSNVAGPGPKSEIKEDSGEDVAKGETSMTGEAKDDDIADGGTREELTVSRTEIIMGQPSKKRHVHPPIRIRVFESKTAHTDVSQYMVELCDGKLFAETVAATLGRTDRFWVSANCYYDISKNLH